MYCPACCSTQKEVTSAARAAATNQLLIMNASPMAAPTIDDTTAVVAASDGSSGARAVTAAGVLAASTGLHRCTPAGARMLCTCCGRTGTGGGRQRRTAPYALPRAVRALLVQAIIAAEGRVC